MSKDRYNILTNREEFSLNRSVYKAMKYLKGMSLDTSTALITDGRFSGTNNGCFVGHISPEAAAGGPLAIVKDGDEIEIDAVNGKLELHVSDEEIARRFKELPEWKCQIKRGYLALYSRTVSSAAEGSIIKW